MLCITADKLGQEGWMGVGDEGAALYIIICYYQHLM
jgi:hypothetical protein